MQDVSFEDQLSMVEQAVDSVLSSKKPGSHIPEAEGWKRNEFVRGMKDVRATAKAIRRSLESSDGCDEDVLLSDAIRLGRLMVACRTGYYRDKLLEGPPVNIVASFPSGDICFNGVLTECEYTYREHIRTGLRDLFEPMELGMKVLLCGEITTTIPPKKKPRKSRKKSG